MNNFILKFTPENLQRHLARNPNEMWTVRNELKALQEDTTTIDGDTWVVKHCVAQRTTGPGVSRSAIGREWYRRCGFADPFEMFAEIERCYGNIPEYLHFLYLVRVRHDPVTDYQNTIPEALALAAMLKVNHGGPIPLDEANMMCNRYGISICDVESRYPDIICRIQETITTEEDGVYQEIANIIEFGEYNDKGEALYQQIRSLL